MDAVFGDQRIDRRRFAKREKRGFRRRNKTYFAPAFFAKSADKTSSPPDDVNFRRFDHDFGQDFSHKIIWLPRLKLLKHIILSREFNSRLACGK